VLLVEQNELASGSTGGSFGGVRQFSTPLEIELSRRGLEFWKMAGRVFNSAVPFDQCGYLFVTGQIEIMERLRQAAGLQAEMGLREVCVLDAEGLVEAAPWISPEGLLGGSWTPGDGRVTPPDGVAALTRAARAAGATVREHWPVRSFERSGGRWVVRGPVDVETERVVVCTGFWSSELLRPFGLELTIRPIARFTSGNVDLGGDGHPYVGEVETDLWMAAGFGGHGTLHGPVVGRLLAAVMAGHPDPTIDISSLDLHRPLGRAEEWMVATRKTS
jgi:sarcosine oxidase, subunit beta